MHRLIVRVRGAGHLKFATTVLLLGAFLSCLCVAPMIFAVIPVRYLVQNIGPVAFVLALSSFPTACVGLWLVYDKNPNVLKILAVQVFAGLCLLFVVHFLSLGIDSVGPAYLSTLLFPFGAGLLAALAAYGWAAKSIR